MSDRRMSWIFAQIFLGFALGAAFLFGWMAL